MLLTAIFLCLLPIILGESPAPSLVTLPALGQLEGYIRLSQNRRQFHAFEGIPYAQPPVGKLRFHEPIPPKPWGGVFQAKTIHKCIQDNHLAQEGEDALIGSEDCLYVNIYTPTLNPKANLDVIVYIHGGAFMFLWGGFYGPNYIMDREVVFVNFNYRLGPFGFLSTESNTIPGNNGIKDQILALKFVQHYIRQFGGNPDSVTLLGMSAGGASVHLHYLTPKSAGLFARGISQSGTALNPWVFMETPLAKTQTLAKNLGCSLKTEDEMVKCLKRRPARQIVQQVKAFQAWLYIPFSPFGIVVDSWATNPLFPEHPYKLLQAGRIQDLPWIASETNFEGLYPAFDFLLKQEYLDYLDQNWNKLLPSILDYNYTVEAKERDNVSEKIRLEYLQREKLSRENFSKLVDMLSDRLFVNDIHKSVQLHASSVKSPVYFYYFTYRGAQNWHQDAIGRHDDFGVAHAEDTAFVLSTPVNTRTTPDDTQMGEFLLNLLQNYAKTGVPKLEKEGWKPVSKNLQEIVEGIIITSSSQIASGKIEVKHQSFWEALPIVENEKIEQKPNKDEL